MSERKVYPAVPLISESEVRSVLGNFRPAIQVRELIDHLVAERDELKKSQDYQTEYIEAYRNENEWQRGQIAHMKVVLKTAHAEIDALRNDWLKAAIG